VTDQSLERSRLSRAVATETRDRLWSAEVYDSAL